MTVNRNESCTCGSGKKYKKCCMNWRENWALAIDGFACDDQIKKIIRGSFNFIVEHDYQGGCHLISAIIHILLTEKGYDSVVRIGEVKINNFVFDHSWVEIEGEVIDIAIMNTLQNGLRFAPVIYGKSITTGTNVEYTYGVSHALDATAQLVISQSIGQYIMDGVSHGSLEIMKLIAEDAGIMFDNIHEIIGKYLDTYRIKFVAQPS
ncbi:MULTISPECIES: SEC-C metal-binding domain-containing protein [Bacillus cereus group]|uniref:SEC-C metal-binding domain-containing protein n=1 Tax=Bacillus cereus group TaxID=86661 RepID=UPI002378EC4B|nr:MULTISPECIES: SEC-C metal-binding domain-containing protein [Bacillus cereus group]MDD9261699.1 SEC-C metal-binding domain-containing protein [Bacillus toyonensis]WJE60511.1 SEC-C metal-binding domain-containing protein [Bacillus mycoides]